MKRRQAVALLCLPAMPAAALAHGKAPTPELPTATAENAQSVLAQALRTMRSLAALGEPVPDEARRRILQLEAQGEIVDAAHLAARVLAERTLINLSINPEARVVATRALRLPALVQGGWRSFLVRIDNPHLVPGKLSVHSAQSLPTHGVILAGIDPIRLPTSRGDLAQRWMELTLHADADNAPELEPVPTDYKILTIYARDSGLRTAEISFNIGPGTGDLGQRDRAHVHFRIAPARIVQLEVLDDDGTPTTCSWLIKDSQGRVVPAQAKRSPPDFYFQQKVYRAHGQTLRLPPGTYSVTTARGPEYLEIERTLRVNANGPTTWRAALQRWVNPTAVHWYSGDHHIHGAGCAHYDQPEAGVGPEMIRPQVVGEALAIAGILTWGPGFDEQRKHFTGRDDPSSLGRHRLHYDLEVSGFPSSHCGHLALLGLQSFDFPGAVAIEDWPSSNAPVLRWARSQGAIAGYAHAGSGLWTGNTQLPNLDMPPFDGIGANDFIATLPAGLVDFIGICNHPQAAELNIWYHTLNVGLRSSIAGETDWPCFFEESIGMGRSYVLLTEPLSYKGWCEGLRAGRSYVSEGRVHFLDVNAETPHGRTGLGGEMQLAASESLRLTARIAARLEPAPSPRTEALRKLAPLEKPYWHLERARIGVSRTVPVQLIFNGEVVETQPLIADGEQREHAWTFKPPRSGWIALRVPHAGHTNPMWLVVDGGEIWSDTSAAWCKQAVEACWTQKRVRIRPSEIDAERALYEQAESFYAGARRRS